MPVRPVATLIAFTPALIGLPQGVELAIHENGLRMPAIEAPALPVLTEQIVPSQKPESPAEKQPLPVYPLKQARH